MKMCLCPSFQSRRQTKSSHSFFSLHQTTELRCAGPLPPDPDHRGQLRGLPQDAADQDQGGEGQEEVDGGEGKRGGGEGRLLQS